MTGFILHWFLINNLPYISPQPSQRHQPQATPSASGCTHKPIHLIWLCETRFWGIYNWTRQQNGLELNRKRACCRVNGRRQRGCLSHQEFEHWKDPAQNKQKSETQRIWSLEEFFQKRTNIKNFQTCTYPRLLHNLTRLERGKVRLLRRLSCIKALLHSISLLSKQHSTYTFSCKNRYCRI